MARKKKQPLTVKGAIFVLHGMLKTLDRISDEVITNQNYCAHLSAGNARIHIRALINNLKEL